MFEFNVPVTVARRHRPASWVCAGVCLELVVAAVVSLAGDIVHQQTFVGDVAEAKLGESVAVSGDTMVVGASGNYGNPSSRAFVYVRRFGIWTQEAQLDPPGEHGSATDFGVRVALDEDTAIIGATLADIGPNLDQGAAYVFTRSGTTWTLQATLIASDGAADDRFGRVSIDGDTAAIGALYADPDGHYNQGAAYVFTRTGGTWTQQARLTAGAAEDTFGRAVAVQGDTVIVGSATPPAGAAYVFMRSGTTWTQQAKLTASDGGTNDELFGVSVNLDGHTAVVGAYKARTNRGFNRGAAYVFVRAGTSWSQEAKLVADDGAPGDELGTSVAVSGNVVLATAPQADVGDEEDQGVTYAFTRTGASWSQSTRVVAADAHTPGEQMQVAFDGETAVVGVPVATVNGAVSKGAAYIFWVGTSSFTDEPLTTSHLVKAVNLTELRTRIDALRGSAGLSAFAWTDAVLSPGVTVVKAVHLAELRTALAQVYIATGQTAPTYTDPTLTPGSSVVRVRHLFELRAAVRELE